MEGAGGTWATILTAIAVLAATAQAAVMWMGRDSHIELNLHLVRVKACASVAAKSGPLMSNVNSLADMSVAAETEGDRAGVLSAREYVRQLQGDINESLSILELIGDPDLTRLSASLALDVQNLVNNATGLKNLGDEKYRDLRAGMIESFRNFSQECRDRLGLQREQAPVGKGP